MGADGRLTRDVLCPLFLDQLVSKFKKNKLKPDHTKPKYFPNQQHKYLQNPIHYYKNLIQ